MEEAELYFKEAKQTGKWGKKAENTEAMYAFHSKQVRMTAKHKTTMKTKKKKTNQKLQSLQPNSSNTMRT